MARRIRGQLFDGLLQSLEQPVVGLDRGGGVRLYSDSFKALYPAIKEGDLLWQILETDELVRWVSDTLDSTDPMPREQVMTHFEDSLWMARLEPVWAENGRCSGWILSLERVTSAEPVSHSVQTLLDEVRRGLSGPLTGIKSRLELLLEGAYRDQDLTVELLQQLNEDSNRLARLLFSLQAPTQPDQAPIPEGTSTSIEVIANRVHQTFEPLARSKNLALKIDVKKVPEVGSVTENELNLCLTNLVDNAIKYTALNGYGEIIIAVESTSDSVTIKVDDSGPGIPKAAREVVFDQFYRLTEGPTTKLGGTGLGLWRVREVAEKRNARVWVEDSPLGGAGLRLRFPI